MRISDWSSDVCSSDLNTGSPRHPSQHSTGSAAMPGSETLALRSHARWRVWLAVLAVFVGCGVLGGLGDWRDHHLFFVNTTDSLPNWAFLVDRGRDRKSTRLNSSH